VFILQIRLFCSITILARRLCTSFNDPDIVLPPVSCRLIALDKNTGVCSIGVGEVVRRIIAKAVLLIIGSDIQRAAGSLQLCGGHICGVGAAIHSMMMMRNLKGFCSLMPAMFLIHLTEQ